MEFVEITRFVSFSYSLNALDHSKSAILAPEARGFQISEDNAKVHGSGFSCFDDVATLENPGMLTPNAVSA